MAFRIQDLSIHLSSDIGDGEVAKNEGPPCTMMSGEPERCHDTSLRPCRERSERPKQDPPDNPRGGGGERKGLAFLQARLRESLAPPV